MLNPARPTLADAGASAGLLAVRRHNLALVLAHLRASGARSRATIAAETGLNKATVSSLVAEGETERGAVGRPSQQVDLHGGAFFTVGAEVNLGYLAVVALNVRSEVLAERWVPVAADEVGTRVVLPRLAALVLEVAAELTAAGSELVGVTLAVPGLVERSTGPG
ncbi:MAG: ROK family transcriptional regulator, partial [Propionibacteriaceae bacterium]